MLSFLKKDVKQDAIGVLDGVRAIACLSVIAYHINRYTSITHVWTGDVGPLASSLALIGWSGVTLFFILSGFLLFRPYAKAILFDEPWPSLRLFYTRRALRIWPAYYVALLLLILLTQQQFLQAAHLPDLGLFVTFFMDSSHATYQEINGPFWTLAVEWQYYLLLPLLAWLFCLIARHGRLRWRVLLLALCLFALIGWGLATRYWGRNAQLHPAQSSFLTHPLYDVALFFLYGQTGKFLEDFAIGMLVCLLYVLAKRATGQNLLRIGLEHLSMWLWGLGLVALVFMAAWSAYPTLSWLDPYIGAHNWLCELGLAIAYGLCLLAVLFGPPGLQRPFAWWPLRWIGLISFSLYIWHLPLINFFIMHILPHVQGHRNIYIYASYWLWVVVAVVPFSYLSFKLIEQPWIKLADRTRRKEVLARGSALSRSSDRVA